MHACSVCKQRITYARGGGNHAIREQVEIEAHRFEDALEQRDDLSKKGNQYFCQKK